MPTYANANRFRADLIDVAWAKETTYGVNPKQADLAALTLNSTQTTIANEMWGQWGLVTGGIDLPNPTYEWTPFFGLGVLDRNMLFPVQGRERLEGRIGTALLCHDSSRLFLEQCLGLIFNGHNLMHATNGTYIGGTTVATPSYTSSSGTAAVTTTSFTVTSAQFGASASSNVKGTSTVPVAIVIVSDINGTVPDPTRDTWAYIGATSGTTVLDVFMDYGLQKSGWNGIVPPGGSGTRYSCHSITRLDHDNAVSTLGVTASAAPGQYCYIRPTLVQPSFMIGARFRADDGSNFITNYMGCKASRVVFNFEEGNPVNYGVDFIAQDMRHNMGEDSGLGASAEKTTKYKALTTSAAVGRTIPPNLSTHTRVTEQPYFFSKVTLKFYQYEIARFRRFSLTIDNQLDPRYYLNQNETGDPIEGRQVLTEILEGRRNVSFSGSLDMDDNAYQAYPSGTTTTDAQFVRYLLNQSFNDADIRDMATLKGIHIQVELRRMADASVTATPFDTMIFSIPSYAGGSPAEDRVGMVLRSASMNVPAPPSIHVPIDIDGFASNVDIRIADNVA